MSGWDVRHWHNERVSGPRRDRRSGEYRAYQPDHLVGEPLALDAKTDAAVAAAETAVRALDADAKDLAGVSRFLLRSEAIASSRIEGISPSAKQVALAELGQTELVRGVSDPAKLVANNMTLVRDATTHLLTTASVEVSQIETLHRALLPDEPKHHGVRIAQNWIGGSNWHPLEADFVPPRPELVHPLLQDLVGYLAGAAHSPIVQAALVHAQFETIHPFSDGNGRVGRALIHTVLARRQLTRDAVLPISLVLSTLREDYVHGLTAYRCTAPAGSPQAMAARAAWIARFAYAATLAAGQAQLVAREIREARAQWEQHLAAHRTGKRALRSDSATYAILGDLPGTPILTAQTVERIHRVSRQAAGRALEELTDAGVLGTKTIGPGRVAYVAPDILDLITWAERRLASTKFDTRQSPPHSGVPEAPAT